MATKTRREKSYRLYRLVELRQGGEHRILSESNDIGALLLAGLFSGALGRVWIESTGQVA